MKKSCFKGCFCSKAFTLIELLVVVLIIGILAAVAVPQYQKAVLKSRLMQGIVYVKAVHDAQEVYFLEHGEYTTNLEALDVKVECPINWVCGADQEKSHAAYDDFGINYAYAHGGNVYEGMMFCWASKSNAMHTSLCRSLGTILDDKDGDSAVRYRLN